MPDVVDRLLDQAKARPDAPAVVESARTVSYGALVDKAKAFAAAFAQHEQPRTLIALPQGADAYAAMFGSLMAGGTYAPVNVSSPHARLEYICAAFAPHIIVARQPLADALAAIGPARIVDPDTVAPRDLIVRSRNAIAYVIFTSGSTGEPKGVAIPRIGLDHYVDWLGPAMSISPEDRMSQHPTIGFDLSVLDIYGALCFGASLYPLDTAIDRVFPARKIQNARLTIWNSVPSVVSLMAQAGEVDAAHLASVRLFTFCGEVLRPDQAAAVLGARPDAIVFNTYGPTEATVAMTCRPLMAGDVASVSVPSVPIGDAIGTMRLDLLDEQGRVLERDGEGEMIISGPQVAAGYWNDTALTAAKFRDVQIGETRTRAFFTGDYAVRRGAETYFLGRRDDMIKLHGHRIHLGEIRGALRDIGWHSSFACESDGRILAAVEDGGDLAFDEADILDRLSRVLDRYFLPETITCIKRFPRNANDKIDAAALKRLIT